MRQPIRVMFPDGDKQVAVRFYPDKPHVEIEWSPDHYLDMMFDSNRNLVASNGYPHEESIGHDPVGELARLVSISRPLADLIVSQFLELSTL